MRLAPTSTRLQKVPEVPMEAASVNACGDQAANRDKETSHETQ